MNLSELTECNIYFKQKYYLFVCALVSFDKTKKKGEEKNEEPSDPFPSLTRNKHFNGFDIFNAKKIFMCRSIWRKELKNMSCSILGLYKGKMTRKEIIHLGLCLITVCAL